MKTKINKTVFYTFAIVLITLTSCSERAIPVVNGKGPMVTEDINIRSINGVDIRVSGNLIITQGTHQEIQIEGQQNILDNLEFKYQGDTWIVKNDRRVRDHDGLTFYVTVPNIEELSLSGDGQISSTNQLNCNDLKVNISGSGDINLEAFADEIDANISGSGEISIEGEANHQDIDISGSGSYRAFELPVNFCDIHISGSGKAKVTVNEKLDASISGSGDVYYIGYPSIKSHLSGSGNIISNN